MLEEANESILEGINILENRESKRGRPKINIPIANIENLLTLNFHASKIAEMYGVSQDTIYRRLQENNISVSIDLFILRNFVDYK